MSWRDYQRLIENRDTNSLAWKEAREGNPNAPYDALVVAVEELPHGTIANFILSVTADNARLTAELSTALRDLEVVAANLDAADEENDALMADLQAAQARLAELEAQRDALMGVAETVRVALAIGRTAGKPPANLLQLEELARAALALVEQPAAPDTAVTEGGGE